MKTDIQESRKPRLPGGYREVLRVAYPLIISMGSFTIMQFGDRMFLSWYSATAIQAALPAGILSFAIVCGFMALAGYANTFVSQYHGAGSPLGCSRATAQGVILALASWPLMLLLIPVGRQVLAWSSHPPEVFAAEVAYFDILMLGSITPPLGAAISSFFTGRGDTLTNMYAHIVGNICNLLLDYVLIFGHWGFPEMGIRGAAWGTVIAGFVPPGIMFAIYFSRRYRRAFETLSTFRFNAPLMARMIRFGFPSALHLVLDVGSFSIFVLLIGRLGRTALTASNIALAVNTLAFMPLIGIGMAATILVGQYQGKRDSATAERAGYTSLKLSLMYMGLIGMTFILFPRAYFELFARGGPESVAITEVMPLGRYLLLMMALWGVLDAINIVMAFSLKGAGDTRFVMIYSVINAWCIWLVGEFLIIFHFEAGVLAAWAWLSVYVFLLAAGYFWRFRMGRWKTIELLEPTVTVSPDRPGAEGLAVVD